MKNALAGLVFVLAILVLMPQAFAGEPVSSNGKYSIKEGGGTFFVQRNGYTSGTSDTLAGAKKVAEGQAETMGDDMSGGWSDENDGEGDGDDTGGEESNKLKNKPDINTVLMLKILDRLDKMESGISGRGGKSLRR